MTLSEGAQRIKDLEAELLKVVQSHSILSGHLEEAKHWLKQLEASEVKVEEPVKEVEAELVE